MALIFFISLFSSLVLAFGAGFLANKNSQASIPLTFLAVIVLSAAIGFFIDNYVPKTNEQRAQELERKIEKLRELQK
jgi:membrane protein YqaA with SNARE-associated domain